LAFPVGVLHAEAVILAYFAPQNGGCATNSRGGVE
jgi:hypothetical protein